MKKVLAYTGVTLLVLLVLALVLPFLFKDKIIQLVKSEIQKNVEAKVEFKDVSLSFFRHFPKVSVGLEDISIVGKHEFSKDTLLSASMIDASVNLLSLVSGKDIDVSGVYLDAPRIHALVNKEGKANWDITKEDTTSSVSTDTSSSFSLKLKKYEINDGYVLYKDESAGIHAEIIGLNHEGSGNFTDDLFTLSTSTKAGSASFSYANMPYLVNAETDIDADIEVDNKTTKFTFKNADIAVNNLKLGVDGFFQLLNDSTYNMDISFNAPSNDFKDILSLVPAIYKNDFDKLKTSGTASFKGFVKGTYSPQQIPAYQVDLGIKDGFFQYPDLPQPVKNIQLAAHVANPDGITDHTIVDVTKGHLEMGNEPFDFRLLFKNPETSRYIDAVVKGKLNLADLTKFVKLDAATKLSGLVWADVFAKGNLSAIEQQKGPFTAGGFLDVRNLYYASKDFPQPVQNGNFKIQLENNGGIADATVVNITSGHIEVSKDPIDFTLLVRNPVSTIDFSGKASGRFTLDNIKQFVQLEPGTSISGLMDADLQFSGSKAAIDKKAYDQINTTGVVHLKNTNYISKEYPEGVKVNTAQLKFDPKNVALNDLDAQFQGTHFTANGVLNNLIGYALQNQVLTGTVNMTADKMNLNEWMGTDTTTTTSSVSSEPFQVPANLNLTVNAKADAVQYDKVVYNNVRGSLLLKEETVQLQQVQTEALDGTIAFNGSYSTKVNKAQPAISINYNIKDVDIQKAFFAYNTMQKLMPIGKFLSGKLTSQMNMSGQLNGDMMPNFSSLTGKGSLFLIQGVLAKFQPLEKLASTLQINELKNISLKDVKSHVEFSNGQVLVKPFDIKVKDIDMQVGGMHGFDQTIDYIIAMKVPRKYLGTGGNALVNNLASQASNRGIPVNLGEVVDLKVSMGGSITNPVIKTDLKAVAGDAAQELKQQAVSFAQQKIDSTKQTFKDSMNSVKKQVANDLKNELNKQLFGPKDSADKGNGLDSTKQKAAETIKNTLKNVFKKKKPAEE
ncbi:hypothetical protein OCK74_18415 [Chitinophagaceae bacterium LB-8]|uniref:AsmA family protein n=1 Tax=Paraflavisolibacter caeni TaxID=2982496 RepID=A0A9X2XXT7_9BACT|nr:AsmA-like C-terminal region-containing protein [Paraflavisolibacter caeni]MCU7551100.1 hypothetical protein [Paraflavisolibacter caeni]